MKFRVLCLVLILVLSGHVTAGMLYSNSFEYASVSEILADGWSAIAGSTSNISFITDPVLDGTKSIDFDDSGVIVIQKVIYPDNMNDVDVSVRVYYDPDSGYTLKGLYCAVLANDGRQDYMLVRRWATGEIQYTFNGSSYANTGLEFTVGWNEIKFTFMADGSVAIFINGDLIGVSPEGNNNFTFGRIRMGRNWAVGETYGDTIYDKLEITSPATELPCSGDWGYLMGDISGPEGVPDCYVDWYDFAEMAQNWQSTN